VDEEYSEYFGLTGDETGALLSEYGLALDENVKRQYDGYVFGSNEMYNPWSILNYAERGILKTFWINTSTNFLIHQSIANAGESFLRDFDKLISEGAAEVYIDMECSFAELENDDTLWGLLVTSGYITVLESLDVEMRYMLVRIPNGEVRSEFAKIVANRARIGGGDLHRMFRSLLKKDMDGFMKSYSEIVLSCTSYHDAKENAYHMLFLGMCITLQGMYKITSNIESGHGRSDIRMESLSGDRPHIIIEFKQGEDVEKLKDEALAQILKQRYYAGLEGEVLCIGVAHDKKKCAMAVETVGA
jgi:hypothetical protein